MELESPNFTSKEPHAAREPQVADLWSRQLEFLAQFSIDIQHVSGDSNAVADAFSRIEDIHLSVKIDFDTLAMEQESDNSFESLMRTGSGLKLKPIKFELCAAVLLAKLAQKTITSMKISFHST
ncbi:hypothetical protein AVEN_48718-1, partial [Araneus ventricosus]